MSRQLPRTDVALRNIGQSSCRRLLA